jgi:two-component system chemotaxis response regulator CheY
MLNHAEATMRQVLIVDDSSLIRRVSRRMLESLSFVVIEAENGLDAIRICQSEVVDLVLLDWNMPVMDGLSFLKLLRSSTLTKQPKVIFCTTEQSPEKISLAMECGANEFLMKPYDEEILHLKLRQVGIFDEPT